MNDLTIKDIADDFKIIPDFSNYDPEEAVVDFVDNFLLKALPRYILLNVKVKWIEGIIKERYLKHPEARKELADDFSADVIFHTAYVLSNRGKENE
jgi:hypothetical protein